MKLTTFIFLLIANFFACSVYAIDPVYDGANGIREKIFATNCLLCHSSTSTKRFGAPSSVNWDTYDAALAKAPRAIARAVVEGSMPPSFSPTSPLNEEQKAAMLAWQKARFPKSSSLPAAATFDFDTLTLTLPVVNVGNLQVKTTLTLTSLSTSPTGVGFVLGPVSASTESSDNPATFDSNTGQLHLPVINIFQKGLSQGQISAEMVFIPGSSPAILSLTSVTPK